MVPVEERRLPLRRQGRLLMALDRILRSEQIRLRDELRPYRDGGLLTGG
jgi:hypothetical protein